MANKVLITAALPYANGQIHFGHLAGAYLPADCYARFCRLQGKRVAFICGSDEYGTAIVHGAELAGRTPQQQVDLYHKINKDLFERLSISFDHYSRTTIEEHKPIVQQFFLDLLQNGYIETRETEQLYSEKEKRFLADRFIVGTCPKCGFTEARGDECPKCGASYEATELKEPRSKMTQSPLMRKATTHWFLRCDLFKEKLTKWLETRDWKANVKHFIEPYITELRPRAITRDMTWGVPIPLPNTEGKVLYVWFDAPIGYISATKEKYPDTWKEFWCDEKTEYVQFIGKDNIVFHAVIFPAMVMGQNQPYKLVDHLPANEFLNLEGKKFSKSSGWYVDMAEFIQSYSPELLRYTLAANAPETQDAEFTFKDFQTRVNAELVGKFGNFVHRTLTFIWERYDKKLPTAFDQEVIAQADALVADMHEAFSTFKLRRATTLLMELATLGNVYFDHHKPWLLLREHSPQLEQVLGTCVEIIRRLVMTSAPIIPKSAEAIGQMIQLPITTWEKMMQQELTAHEPKPLFKKVEDAEVASLQKSLEQPSHTKSEIAYDDFSKVDIRVGRVLSAEPVPKSNKLLKIEVDLGFETRTIVSGIAKHYTPEGLLHRNVLVVVNLKPAKLMGVESRGMILAAGDGTLLELPSLQTAPPGTSVS